MTTLLDRFLARQSSTTPPLGEPGANPVVKERGLFAAIKPPPKGHVLVVRRPRALKFTIVYPDGQSETMANDHHFEPAMLVRGIPMDKIKRAIDYAWNFGAAYVLVGEGLKPPTS